MGSDRSLTPSLHSRRPEATSTKAWCNCTRHLAEAGRGLFSYPTAFHFIHGTSGRPHVLTTWSRGVMNGTEIRQLNAEDAAEYQAIFLGALQSAPTAFAADYGEESGRSSDQIAERFRREVIFGASVDGRLCAIATFLQQTSPKRRRNDMIWNMYVSEERRGTWLADIFFDYIFEAASPRVDQ